MDEAVVVTDLVKQYRPNMPPAVNGLSFSVASGEVFGLLGPNGAGKSTTIGVLTTRVRATSGRAMVCGVDVSAQPAVARKLFAVVPQRINLDRSLTVRQNLLMHGMYHRISRRERTRRADELLEHLGLKEFGNARVDFLSGGLAQRVMIARALMHRPRVLFLDEPSGNLDPQSRLFVHERIAELRREGITIMVTTHDMDEAEKLCDRVGIIDHGRLLTQGTPAELTKELPGSTTLTVSVTLQGSSADQVQSALADIPDVDRVEKIVSQVAPELAMMPMLPGAPPPVPPSGDGEPGAQFRIYTGVQPATIIPITLTVLANLDCTVRDFGVGQPSLEDLFIHLTGRELR